MLADRRPTAARECVVGTGKSWLSTDHRRYDTQINVPPWDKSQNHSPETTFTLEGKSMSSRRRSLLRLLALLLSFVLIAAACGDDSGDGDTATDDTTPSDDTTPEDDMTDDSTTSDDDMTDDDMTDEVLTASYTGVTETTISVGVSLLDFQKLVDLNLSPAGWGDQVAAWEAMFDSVNAAGGIAGRQVEAVYEFYSPIDPGDADRVCTALTQDNEVFAVLGGFVGPLAGTADPCITGLNETILIGGDQNDDELAQSVAPWYMPGQAANASTVILLNLLEETGALEGAKVFVMGGLADEASQEQVLQELADRGVEVVGQNLVLAVDGDTAAQDDELGIITEQIKSSGATAVFIHGTPSSSIRGLADAGLITELDIWANNPSGLANLGNTITDKSVANGIVTAAGPSDTSIWEDPAYQTQCSDVVAAAVPEADIRPPLDYAEDEENWFNGIRYGCRLIDLFAVIANEAGPELNHDTFRAAAESLSDFSFAGSPSASLSPEKFFADDLFSLAVYDSTAGDGQAVPTGDLVDIFE
jgi:hypothetical protein